MLNKRILVLVSLLLISFLLIGCEFPWTVPEIVNHAPVITEIPDDTATVGVAYTFQVIATDADGDALTYSLTISPPGMEIDEYNGLITWTPSELVGAYGFTTVKVTDGVLYDTQSFTVTVEPVKPTEIEVTPDTMDLKVDETKTFTVTAHLSDGTTEDVTNLCGYVSNDPSVATVEAGKVTAVAKGIATITVTYKRLKANISVTVRIPMEITVDLPTFTVGIPAWFIVEMTANDDSGKSVTASFDWPISETDVQIAGTLETDFGSEVIFTLEEGDVFKSEEFIMEGTITVNFRGTFTSAGTYGTTLEVSTTDGILLCSKVITIVVE